MNEQCKDTGEGQKVDEVTEVVLLFLVSLSEV